jgi:hypothetical protein
MLAISASTVALANASMRSVSSSTSDHTNTQVAQANRTLVGTFVAAEAPTTGTARVVTENGHRYLELDSAFSTTNQAPDLHVLLDSAQVPPRKYTNFGSYINLGRLERVSGAQRYPIPDSVNLAQFRSVVIWCRMANATMGYAVLGGNTSARVQ